MPSPLNQLVPDREYNGELYYSVKKFAKLTNRSEQTIRLLINHGNIIRKLKAVKPNREWLVPISEYGEFPFVEPGYAGRNYHQYNIDGSLRLGKVGE